MPGYNYNQRFLDPEKVLFRAGLTVGQNIADLGAGSGFYALASARVVGQGGKVYVVDLLEESLAHVAGEAQLRLLKNVQTIRADLDKPGATARIPDGSCDMVVFGNLFHQIKNRKNLLAEAYKILKSGGKLLLVDWNDRPGPIGPKHEDRIGEESARKHVTESGFSFNSKIETDPYHYGLIFTK